MAGRDERNVESGFHHDHNPPGGVLQANDGAIFEKLQACSNRMDRPCPREAVLAIIYTIEYYHFQACNAIAFVASLSVTLFLASGFPPRDRFPMWLLSIGMIFTLTFLALAYLFAMLLVTPTADGTWDETWKIVRRTISTWIALAGILTLFCTVRFLVWLLNKCIKRVKHRKPAAAGDQDNDFRLSHVQIAK